MSKTLTISFAAAIFAAGLVASASAQMGPNPGDPAYRHDQVDQRGAPNGDMRDHRDGDMRDHRDGDMRDRRDGGWRDHRYGGWRHHHRHQICYWRYHHRVCTWR